METIRVSECCKREVEPSAYRCTYCEFECKVSEFDSDKIKYMIEPGSIEWDMNWSGNKPDGGRMYPDKPDKEIIFEPQLALALLLNNQVICIDNHWWEKDWPEKARNSTYLGVNCSDVFSWGCSECEEISYREIKDLYLMYKQDSRNGPILWCMKKRREMPQNPVADSMRKEGIDLDAFQKEHNLRVNLYNGFNGALHKAGIKYDDANYANFRAQWIKDNGWEGEAK